ncbi:hypothetical protein F183_A52830 [Bryobacterales bacterium F-183]|nr:hypothetical protein F183_A52830 [Bryobacterales bacterium F-183]
MATLLIPFLLLSQLSNEPDWQQLLDQAIRLRDSGAADPIPAFNRAMDAAATSPLGLLRASNELGVYLVSSGKFQAALQLLRPRVAQCSSLTPPEPVCAAIYHNVGLAHHSSGEPLLAVAILRRAVALVVALEGQNSPNYVGLAASLGGALIAVGQLRDAEMVLRRAVPVALHSTVAEPAKRSNIFAGLSEIHRHRNELALARSEAIRAVRIAESGMPSPDAAMAAAGALYRLSSIQWAEGSPAPAMQSLQKAIQIAQAQPVAIALNSAILQSTLALMHLKTGHLEQAKALLADARAAATKANDNPALSVILQVSASVALREKDAESAASLLHVSLNLADSAWGPVSLQAAGCVADLVAVLLKLGKLPEAEALSRRADAIEPASGAEPAWIPVVEQRAKVLAKLKWKKEAASANQRLKGLLAAYPTQPSHQVDVLEMFRAIP